MSHRVTNRINALCLCLKYEFFLSKPNLIHCIISVKSLESLPACFIILCMCMCFDSLICNAYIKINYYFFYYYHLLVFSFFFRIEIPLYFILFHVHMISFSIVRHFHCHFNFYSPPPFFLKLPSSIYILYPYSIIQ